MKNMKVLPIKNGTVIDHIPVGLVFKVARILGILLDAPKSTVSLASRVPSTATKWKDLIKIEDRELDAREVNKIALIAPNATISIIRNMKVVKKTKVSFPTKVVGLLRCQNPNCITNANEPVVSEFICENVDKQILRCKYCEREVEDLESSIR